MLNTILWIFLAFAFGLILFFSIQDRIPDELSFLKGTEPEKTFRTPDGSVMKVQEYQGWSIRSSQSTVELVKKMFGEGTPDTRGGVPAGQEIGILCNAGKLDMRLDVRGPTTGVRSTPVVVDGLGEMMFDKGTGTNIFPQDPLRLLQRLNRGDSVRFVVEYSVRGTVALTLDSKGLGELTQQLPASCR